jgi:hypothetical protein
MSNESARDFDHKAASPFLELLLSSLGIAKGDVNSPLERCTFMVVYLFSEQYNVKVKTQSEQGASDGHDWLRQSEFGARTEL